MKKEKIIKIFKIFGVFFKIGLFTFGGGFAMVPLVQREFTEKHDWIEKEEFINSISLTQSVPGSLAVNLSIFQGYKLAGFSGALAAAIGVSLPSFLIILFVAMNFSRVADNEMIEKVFKGIKPAVVGLIVYTGVDLFKSIEWNSILFTIFIATLFLNGFLNFSPIIIIISVIFITLASYTMKPVMLAKKYNEEIAENEYSN
jgi:chromate transporter